MDGRRDFLRKHGFNPGPRGRFSREMLDFLAQHGYATKTEPVVRAPRAPKVTVEPPKIIGPRRRATQYVYVDENKKNHFISNTNACKGCGYSLMFCPCDQPMALVKGILHYVPVEAV